MRKSVTNRPINSSDQLLKTGVNTNYGPGLRRVKGAMSVMAMLQKIGLALVNPDESGQPLTVARLSRFSMDIQAAMMLFRTA